MVIMSPVEKGKSSPSWAPSKSYNAVAVPRPFETGAGAGATGGGGIGLEAAGAGGGAEEDELEEEEKRALNSGRAAKYWSRRAKKASFSAESCSMAVKTPPPWFAGVAVVDAGVRARDTGGGGVTPAVEEACLIGGGGGLDAAGDEAAARDGEAAPLALLPARGRCAA